MTHSVSPEKLGKSKRSFKNFLLQPSLQLPFGMYSVLISLVFSIMICVVLYVNLGKFVEVVLELTGVEDEVRDLMIQYMQPARIQMVGLVGLYVLTSVFFSIKITHRLVGPTIAFRKHIQSLIDGNYEHRTVLRQGDAFTEVATDLNRLSDELAKKLALPK